MKRVMKARPTFSDIKLDDLVTYVSEPHLVEKDMRVFRPVQSRPLFGQGADH